MDIDDLALIGSDVKLKEVPPIHQKRTLAFVNTFITNTVSILNNLARTSDLKLQTFEEKLQKIDASLCILEANLASIPGLEIEQEMEPLSTVISSAKPPEIVNNQQNTEIHLVDDSKQPENSIEKTCTSEVLTDDSTEQDPNYTKFFKMVQFGVPPQAVKLKMQSEGLNPDFLDNPKSVPRVPKKVASSATSSDEESE